MNILPEIWKAGSNFCYLYTENNTIAKMLKNIFGRQATYERNGKVFAWQFIVPKNRLGFIQKEISKILSIEIQQLTEVKKAKNRLRRTSRAKDRDSYHPEHEKGFTIPKESTGDDKNYEKNLR